MLKPLITILDVERYIEANLAKAEMNRGTSEYWDGVYCLLMDMKEEFFK